MYYNYSVIINKKPKETASNIYSYKYGNTDNIKFVIDKNAFCVSANMTVKKESDQIISHPLFADAMKKAMLIHIIKFSENMKVRTVHVRIDDEETEVFNSKTDGIFIYSLVNGKLFRNIPESWNNRTFIQSILNIVKSNYDSRMAALFSIIISKSKIYESERFNYMWYAFNGMYNYFWNVHVKKHITVKDISDSEMNQLTAIMIENDIPTGFIERKSAGIIAEDVQSIINNEWDGKIITRDALESGELITFAEKIKNVLYSRIDSKGKVFRSTKGRALKYFNDITPYSYLFILLPYHVRCDMVHANTPLKLFSYEEESDIKLYRFVSNMLENYIDENLVKWFDTEYTESELTEKAIRAAAFFNEQKKDKSNKNNKKSE